MSTKTFLRVVGTIFTIVGLVHLLRLLTGFQVMFGGWELPFWVSIVGVIVAGYLAYNAFGLSKKKNTKK